MHKVAKVLIILFAILVAVLSIWFFSSKPKEVEHLLKFIKHLGIFGNLIFILLFLILSFPFAIGYTPISLAAGFLYGIIFGTLTIWLGAMIGSSFCFFVAKKIARNQIEKLVSNKPQFSILLNAISQNGWKVIFLSRMTPIPFGLQNAIFAITDVNYFTFITATACGLLPEQLLWTYLGNSARDLHEIANGNSNIGHKGRLKEILIFVEVAVVVLIAIVITVFVKREWRKTTTKKDIELAASPILFEVQNDEEKL